MVQLKVPFIDFGYGIAKFIDNSNMVDGKNSKKPIFPFVKISDKIPSSYNVWFLPPAIMGDEVFMYLSEKYVPNTMNRYIVSNYGRIYDVICRRFVPFKFNKAFEPGGENKGYCAAHIAYYKDPATIASADIYIHRAVLMTFDYIEGCEYLEVNHKDGIHLHNVLRNLEWKTTIENNIHAVENHLRQRNADKIGKSNIISKYDAEEICKLFAIGKGIYEISNILNILQDDVKAVVSGQKMPEVSIKYNICNSSNYHIPEHSIRILCELISQGIPISEIAAASGVSKYELISIRDRKMYFDISIDYDFSRSSDIDNYRKSLTTNETFEICRKLESGMTPSEISRDMNINRSTISNIKNKTVYTNISDNYSFPNNINTALSEDLVRAICQDIESGMGNADIGRKRNVSRITVGHIRRGETYTDISKDYKINTPVIPHRNIQDATIHLICKRLQDGEMPKSIADDLRIDISVPNGIKYGKLYANISSNYTFTSKDNSLSDEQVRIACEGLQNGDRTGKILQDANISKWSLYRIRDRETYTDISKDYKW